MLVQVAHNANMFYDMFSIKRSGIVLLPNKNAINQEGPHISTISRDKVNIYFIKSENLKYL